MTDLDKFRELVEQTVTRLRDADGDRKKIESAIKRYLTRGDVLGMSPYILWDYFAISSPGIAENAGYCGDEYEKMVTLYTRLSKAKFSG
jgi:hypothetical protein